MESVLPQMSAAIYTILQDLAEAKESEAFSVMCRGLRQIAGASFAALASFDPDTRILQLEAIDEWGGDPMLPILPVSHVTLLLPPEAVEAFLTQPVQDASQTSKWIAGLFPSPLPLGTPPEESGGLHTCTCACDGQLQFVALLRLPSGHVLSLEAVEAFLRLVGPVAHRDQVRRSLKTSEDRLRRFIESADAGYLALDLNFRVLQANEELLRLCGRAMFEDVLGREPDAWLTPQSVEIFQRARSACLLNGAARNLELEFVAPDLTVTPVEMTLTLVSTETGAEIIAGCRDISERYRNREERRLAGEELERRVEERTNELIAANQALAESLWQLQDTQSHQVESEKMAALGELVAGVAHEINTPVGIALTAASHLEDISEDISTLYHSRPLKRSELENYIGQASESAQIILGNLQRAASLIQSFKQTAVDQASQQKRRFALRAYLEEVLYTLSPKFRGTPYKTQIIGPEEIEIDSYPGVFSQILSNLVINSLLHGFEGRDHGTITIELGRWTNGHLQLVYRDDGRGMEEETLSRLFEPFFTTKPGSGGSGLGMHIVYNQVCKTLGGQIRAISQPNQGLTVEIIFPVEPTPDFVLPEPAPDPVF
jgi:PAS domain S-box-containing protein